MQNQNVPKQKAPLFQELKSITAQLKNNKCSALKFSEIFDAKYFLAEDVPSYFLNLDEHANNIETIYHVFPNEICLGGKINKPKEVYLCSLDKPWPFGSSIKNVFEVIPTEEFSSNWITCIELSTDRKTFYTGHQDGTISHWPLTSLWKTVKEPKQKLKGRNPVSLIAPLSDGSFLSVSGKTICHWSNDYKLLHTSVCDFSFDIDSLFLLEDGKIIVSGIIEIGLYSLEDHKFKKINNIKNCKTLLTAALSKNKFIIGDQSIRIKKHIKATGLLSSSLDNTHSSILLQNGNHLCGGKYYDQPGVITLENTIGGKSIENFWGHKKKTLGFILLSDDTFLSYSEDNTICHWSLKKKILLHIYDAKETIKGLVLLSDNKTFLTWHENSTKLWCLERCCELNTFENIQIIHLFKDQTAMAIVQKKEGSKIERMALFPTRKALTIDQQKSLLEILQLGYPPVKMLDLSGVSLNDKKLFESFLESLPNLIHVVELNLENTNLTDEQLEKIIECLKKLKISHLKNVHLPQSASVQVQNSLKSCLENIEKKRNENINKKKNIIIDKPNNNYKAKAQVNNNNNIIIKKVDNKKDQNNNINNNIIKKIDNKKDQNNNINNINKIENNNIKKDQNNNNIIHDYKINKDDVKMGQKIGEGGFGEVYKSRWKNKTVAVKVMAEKKIQNTNEFKALSSELKKEAQILKHLDHSNIVQFFGIITLNKYPYGIVMEYCDKGSLWGLLHDYNSKLNGPASIKIAWDCAKGVAYLHEQKILHRDIKSQNILLVQVNEGYVAKIADFGLSKLVTNDEPWTWCGTRPWMAPEFFKEKIELTEKTDTYAFGIVCWEICTKKSPQNREKNKEINEDDFVNYIPKKNEVARFIQWCIKPEPKNRPNDNQVVKVCEELYNSSLKK